MTVLIAVDFGAVGGQDFGIKPAPLLGFLAGHKCSADGLGVAEYPHLDGFVFARFHNQDFRFNVR